MTEDMSANLSRQVSHETATSPPTALPLLQIRLHQNSFSANDVLINPALVPFARPGSLLQIIPQHDIENEAALPSDRYMFRLGTENEKDFSTKYGNMQVSVHEEIGKTFKFSTNSNVAVALVCGSLNLAYSGKRGCGGSGLCGNGIQGFIPGQGGYVESCSISK